jgi:hypothetical protein
MISGTVQVDPLSKFCGRLGYVASDARYAVMTGGSLAFGHITIRAMTAS